MGIFLCLCSTLSEASGRYSPALKWFICLRDTWPEWRSLKYYRPAAPDLPAPPPASLPLQPLSLLDCFAPCAPPTRPVCPHSILQDTSPSCPSGVCPPLFVCVCVEGGGPQASPLVTLLKCVLIYS